MAQQESRQGHMTPQESHAHQETGLWETQGDRVIDGDEVVITLQSHVYITW